MKRSLRSWLWRVPVDQEVDEELEFHLEMRTRELVQRGMDPAAARDVATRRMSDLAALKRTCVDLGRKRDREMHLTQWLQEFRDDVTFSLRQMRSAPAFTFNAALTLALPMAQDLVSDMYLVVGASPRAEALASPVRAAIGRVDKEQLVSVRDVKTLEDIAREATARHRFRAVLVMSFAALALMLAMVGVFGILAYSVQQRMREFGVRIAMGATMTDVLRLVLGSATRVVVAGA